MTDEDAFEDERDTELSSNGAIFPEISIDGHCATLDIEVAPVKPVSVTFAPDPIVPITKTTFATIPQSDNEQVVVLSRPEAQPLRPMRDIANFPVLHLAITLPDGYPGNQAPVFKLNTDPAWLLRPVLQRLEKMGEVLWEEYGRSQVVFAYIDFLQQEADRCFGLCDTVGKLLTLPLSLETSLLTFDRLAKQEKFAQETFDCGVCLEPKKGFACYRLRRCGHVFCISCLQDFYDNAIAEGDVDSVKCLAPDCGKESLNVSQRRRKKNRTLNPSELLEIPLERAQVQRYVDLKLKKKLDSDKNTVYCPRKWCQAPARSAKYARYKTSDLSNFPDSDSEDEDAHRAVPEEPAPAIQDLNVSTKSAPPDRLSVCSKCSYAFCRICQKTWHGDLQSCITLVTADISVEDKASFDYIRLHTSPCPSCSSPFQKTHGCNHMRCFTCGTHFCYLCSAWLAPTDPYEHFNTRGQPCYMRLWELEEGDEGQNDHVFGVARGFEVANFEAEEQEAVQNANRRGEQQARGLQRFLELAANDEEDEWDSDELDEMFLA